MIVTAKSPILSAANPVLYLVFAVMLSLPFNVHGETDLDIFPEGDTEDVYEFSDYLLREELKYPDWFKVSFGNLQDHHKAALEAGKSGIIVYFGQKRCSYCEKFLKVNLQAPDVMNYIQKHFDVIPIDIWGIEDIVTMEGKTYTEREFSLAEGTNFTPSLLFYDRNGHRALRLRGYYPPYKFRAALKYVVEDFHRSESLRDYLARADPAMVFDPDGLNEQDFFMQPPYNLDRSRFSAETPLVVFFEQGKCHACDVLHTGPMNDERLREEVLRMEAVQLDMWSDTPVITPDGHKMTAREWAARLGLFYAPAMIFFDENGVEIMRVDHVAQFYRLLGVFEYINTRAYKTYPNYQRWRIARRDLASE
jgi:thioredoxin-related protein